MDQSRGYDGHKSHTDTLSAAVEVARKVRRRQRHEANRRYQQSDRRDRLICHAT
jgi:hypothetical protein